MKTYWNQFNDRERWMVCVGSVCCFIYLFYTLLYAPLVNAVHNKSQELSEKRATLIWMQQVKQQYQSKPALRVLSNSKLLSVLSSQLSATTLRHFTYQLQQTGTGDIQLLFDEVPYNEFLKWIESINKQYQISIKQFNVERTPTPGIVKVLLVISSSL